MKTRPLFRTMVISGVTLLLGTAVYFLSSPAISDADAESQSPPVPDQSAAAENPASAPETKSSEPAAAQFAKNANPKSPDAADAAEKAETPDAAQQREFKKFLAEAELYSQSVHEQFRLLEQLAALHPGTGENTNHIVFQQMRLEFEEIGRRAATNDNALQLLLDAAKMRYLQGVAVAGIGVAAGNGSSKAVDLLIEPEKNGWLVSSSAGALVNAARAGNEAALSWMYDLSFDQAKKPLWAFAADGLQPAAESGNDSAIAALVNISKFGNASLRKKVLPVLENAASGGNSTAADALRAVRESAADSK